jgi:hypothetical protein
MTPVELQQKLTAYFHGKGHPAGEPLEEDQQPLVELLKALAAGTQVPAESQHLVERLLLEQLPWAEEEMTTAELERLHGLLAASCEPAQMSPAKDAAILHKIHAAAPEQKPWFSWEIPPIWRMSLSLCSGFAVMILMIGGLSGPREGNYPPPWLELERVRGRGYAIGQTVEIRLGVQKGGFFHLFELDAKKELHVLMVNKVLVPGRKTAQQSVVSGPPGAETLVAVCTSGEIPELAALQREQKGITDVKQLREKLTELASKRRAEISFKELSLEVLPARE